MIVISCGAILRHASHQVQWVKWERQKRARNWFNCWYLLCAIPFKTAKQGTNQPINIRCEWSEFIDLLWNVLHTRVAAASFFRLNSVGPALISPVSIKMLIRGNVAWWMCNNSRCGAFMPCRFYRSDSQIGICRLKSIESWKCRLILYENEYNICYHIECEIERVLSDHSQIAFPNSIQ